MISSTQLEKTLKFTWKPKRPQIAKETLRKKDGRQYLISNYTNKPYENVNVVLAQKQACILME